MFRAWPSAPTARPSQPVTASSTADGGVVLWDAARRKRLVDAPLHVKEGGVSSVAFSPDGKTIAAGYKVGGDRGRGGVVLWDAAGRKRLGDAPLDVKEGEVTSVAFSPDGKTIAAGYQVGRDRGGGVVLWDAAGRKRLGDAPLARGGGQRFERGLQPRRQDHRSRLHLGVSSGVVLWDAAGRKGWPMPRSPWKEGIVKSVAFSPDGKAIAAGYLGDAHGAGARSWRRGAFGRGGKQAAGRCPARRGGGQR